MPNHVIIARLTVDVTGERNPPPLHGLRISTSFAVDPISHPIDSLAPSRVPLAAGAGANPNFDSRSCPPPRATARPATSPYIAKEWGTHAPQVAWVLDFAFLSFCF